MTTSSTTMIAILVFGTMLFTLFAFFVILYVSLQKRKQFQFRNQLMQTRLEVQEQAFKYFSEEIHDNVGAVLSLAKLHLYKILQKAEESTVQKDAEEGTELLTKAIADLRTISHTLNTGIVLNAGLLESVKKELNYVSSAKSINCNFSTEGTPRNLGEEKELLAFRIVQESIANAIKHGNPSDVNVHIHYNQIGCTISIEDNGTGFDINGQDKSKGLGLTNMDVRAGLLKGKLSVNSVKEEGTTIKLYIPYGT